MSQKAGGEEMGGGERGAEPGERGAREGEGGQGGTGGGVVARRWKGPPGTGRAGGGGEGL